MIVSRHLQFKNVSSVLHAACAVNAVEIGRNAASNTKRGERLLGPEEEPAELMV